MTPLTLCTPPPPRPGAVPAGRADHPVEGALPVLDAGPEPRLRHRHRPADRRRGAEGGETHSRRNWDWGGETGAEAGRHRRQMKRLLTQFHVFMFHVQFHVDSPIQE